MKKYISFMLNHYPRLKRLLVFVRNRILQRPSVSSNYQSILTADTQNEGERLRSSWQDQSIPKKQRDLVDKQLFDYRAGKKIDVYDVFVDAIRELPGINLCKTLLEIGCSSGYYSEVLNIAQLPLKYSGCDYSSSFIRMAQEKYPDMEFSIADATNLNFADSSFDIVVSGCCLLHIPDYVSAIKEAVRVASRYVVFHRTPVVWGQDEQWYRKQAYGVETVEIHFNEKEFLVLLHRFGLKLLATYTLNKESQTKDITKGGAIRTYVCSVDGV